LPRPRPTLFEERTLRAWRGSGTGTTGGIVLTYQCRALDEVDSRTLQSKLVPGLYFAGEVLDLDRPIGGYNFQAAFSTGWLAGQSV
jgi:predicted flavoprotein YhiN